MARISLRFVLVAFLVLWFRQASAHPHAWIDIKVEVVFNQLGEVVGLRQTWLFDEAYTAFAVGGLDKARDGRLDPAKLAELLAINMQSLEEYSYFTRVRHDDVDVMFERASDASSMMRGHQLEMSFYVGFSKSVPLSGREFRYAVFDPTYYIEVVHAQSPDAIKLTGAKAGCTKRINQPKPNPEAVSLAYALDVTQSAGDTLGEFFSEWVTIQCR